MKTNVISLIDKLKVIHSRPELTQQELNIQASLLRLQAMLWRLSADSRKINRG